MIPLGAGILVVIMGPPKSKENNQFEIKSTNYFVYNAIKP